MRPDDLYVGEMLEAADEVASWLADANVDDWMSNSMLGRAVLQRLTEVGEAAARVSAELRQRHPAIPWSEIVGFRNIAVHQYFAVDWMLVWGLASRELPELARQVLRVAAAEFPELARRYEEMG